jgi:hypothetical protein
MGKVIEFLGRGAAGVKPGISYRAFEATDGPQMHLFLVFRDPNQYLILRYAELESISSVPGADSNRSVMVRFSGSVVRDVRIDGWRLLDLVRHLRWHHVSVVEESPWKWGHRDDSVAIVTRISVREVRT